MQECMQKFYFYTQSERTKYQEEEDKGSPEPEVTFKQSMVDTHCGILNYRPTCLQPFCRPSCMLADLSWIAVTQSCISNGLISVVLPTIERRFQLKSVESGLILASFNVGNFFTIMPVAFMGSSGHKPVFIAAGVAVMGTGSFLFSLPHFIAPPYQYGNDIQDMCPAGPLPEDLCTGRAIQNYRFLMMLGNALHGIGTTPFYTLGVTYLDENIPTNKMSSYLGELAVGSSLWVCLGGFF